MGGLAVKEQGGARSDARRVWREHDGGLWFICVLVMRTSGSTTETHRGPYLVLAFQTIEDVREKRGNS